MKPKNWLIKLVLVTGILIGIPVGGVVAFNYVVDPLWNFDHENRWNSAQDGFDERQQKLNYIHAHEMDYDSVLIGTSRTTYMNTSHFTNEKVLNFGLSSLHIDEYLPYLQYAQAQNDKPFQTIYMELTNNSYAVHLPQTAKPIDEYIAVTEEPFYRYKSLFSYDTLQKALTNKQYAEQLPSKKPRLYKRNLDTHTSIPSYDEQKQIDTLINGWDAKGENWFEYDAAYKAKLQAIKDAFPDARFVVFNDLMPVSRLEATLNYQDRKRYYNQYVEDVVEVFGTFYSFHNSNEITENYSENFLDLYHFYHHVGDQVIESLENPETSNYVEIIKESSGL